MLKFSNFSLVWLSFLIFDHVFFGLPRCASWSTATVQPPPRAVLPTSSRQVGGVDVWPQLEFPVDFSRLWALSWKLDHHRWSLKNLGRTVDVSLRWRLCWQLAALRFFLPGQNFWWMYRSSKPEIKSEVCQVLPSSHATRWPHSLGARVWSSSAELFGGKFKGKSLNESCVKPKTKIKPWLFPEKCLSASRSWASEQSWAKGTDFPRPISWAERLNGLGEIDVWDLVELNSQS